MSVSSDIVLKSQMALKKCEQLVPVMTSKYSIKLTGLNFTGSLMFYPTTGRLVNNSSLENIPKVVSTKFLTDLFK